MSDVTQLLNALEQGDRQAGRQLLPLVYDELRRLAAAKMAQEKPGHTLEATALVHEAYLRLVKDGEERSWQGRRHFFAAAAEAMRRILIEGARRKRRLRHGGERQAIELDEAYRIATPPSDDVLAVDEALTALQEKDPVCAELVKLHHYAGLTLEECALALGLSERTTYRNWAFARAWLFRRLGPQD